MPHFYCGKAVLPQVAVFVDAGYLYAQGSALLAGQKRARTVVRLSVRDVLNELTFQAGAAAEARRGIDGLTPSDIERVVSYMDGNRERIPFEIDSPTLAGLRNRLGRDLTDDERKEYRTIFATLLRSANNG